jgi:hypothetical protein
MGRRPEFDLRVIVRVTEDLPVRIKAVSRPKENMSEFFRSSALREVVRREKAAARRQETRQAGGRGVHA